jgi:hypothetical protein
MCRTSRLIIATAVVISLTAVARPARAADCYPWDLCSSVALSANEHGIRTSDPFWIWPTAQEVELELRGVYLGHQLWGNSKLRLLDANGTVVPGSEIILPNQGRVSTLLSVPSGQYRLQLEPSHGDIRIGDVEGTIWYNRALQVQSPRTPYPWTSPPFNIGPGTQEVELSLDTVFDAPAPSLLWQNSRLKLVRADTQALVDEVVLCPVIDWGDCSLQFVGWVAACTILSPVPLVCDLAWGALRSCLIQHALECTAPVTKRVVVEPGVYELNLEPSHGDRPQYGDLRGTMIDLNRELDPADEKCNPRDVFQLTAGNTIDSLTGNLEFPGDHDWQTIHPTASGELHLILGVPAGKDYDFELRDQQCAPLSGFPPSTNPAGQNERFVLYANANNDLWVHTFAKNNADHDASYTVTAIVDPKPPVVEAGPWLTGPIEKGPAYAPGRYQVSFSDPEAGLETLFVGRDQYCHTCITNLDGSDCDGVIAVYGSKSPLCSIVSYPSFTPGTQDSVAVTVTAGPDAYQDPNWYFGAKIVATNTVGLTNFSNEWHELLPPTCQVDLLGPTAAGHQQWTYTIRDAAIQNSLGLFGVTPTSLTNCLLSVPVFVVGTQDPVVATATQELAGLPAASAVSVTDVSGNPAACDPVTVMVGQKGKPQGQTFAGISSAAHFVSIRNGAPGLRSVGIAVNTVQFKAIHMKDGELVSIDLGAAMQPGGGNTVVVTASGKPGANAAIVFTTTPVGAP